MNFETKSFSEMKSLTTNTKETPKVTLVSIILALVAVAAFVVDNNQIFGFDSQVVKWISGSSALLTFVVNYIQNNFITNE